MNISKVDPIQRPSPQNDQINRGVPVKGYPYMSRATLRAIVNRLIRLFSRPEFIGTENIPKEGGVIIATNHLSRLDTMLLWICPSEREDITALVADKYQKYPLFKWILDVGGIIWLDRENADFGAMRAAVAALKRGVSLGIAPEGTRSVDTGLLEGKPGTALVALKAGVPIVPVGIAGTENVFKRMLTLQFPRLTLRYGQPFTLPPLERDRRDQQLKECTDEIMCRIAAQLPERYHGFYKDHPRLKELLAEQ
jgi:1-acyl-sn-glycerol-3-phosphate acyltransferase